MIEYGYALTAILAMGLVTFALRAFPFIAAQWLQKNALVRRIGGFLPLAIMTILVIHSAAGSALQHEGLPWPEATAIAATAALQWKTRNPLLSILTGTALYVLLRKFF